MAGHTATAGALGAALCAATIIAAVASAAPAPAGGAEGAAGPWGPELAQAAQGPAEGKGDADERGVLAAVRRGLYLDGRNVSVPDTEDVRVVIAGGAVWVLQSPAATEGAPGTAGPGAGAEAAPDGTGRAEGFRGEVVVSLGRTGEGKALSAEMPDGEELSLSDIQSVLDSAARGDEIDVVSGATATCLALRNAALAALGSPTGGGAEADVESREETPLEAAAERAEALARAVEGRLLVGEDGKARAAELAVWIVLDADGAPLAAASWDCGASEGREAGACAAPLSARGWQGAEDPSPEVGAAPAPVDGTPAGGAGSAPEAPSPIPEDGVLPDVPDGAPVPVGEDPEASNAPAQAGHYERVWVPDWQDVLVSEAWEEPVWVVDSPASLERVWVPDWQDVLVSEAWEEPVYAFMEICSVCGPIVGEDPNLHLLESGHGSWYDGYVQVDAVRHEAVYESRDLGSWQDVWVEG